MLIKQLKKTQKLFFYVIEIKGGANKSLVDMGVTKWDNDPTNNIAASGAQQLASDAPNVVGDRVVYYVDINGNGEFDKGDIAEHSAIVNSVDKDGNTTTVAGKMGQDGISVNQPNAPGYYGTVEENGKTYTTSRAYYRLPAKNNKPASGSSSAPSIFKVPNIMDLMHAGAEKARINDTKVNPPIILPATPNDKPKQ